MKRKFILIIISLIILGSSAYFYFDTIFVPIQFKQFIITRAEKFLGRQVSIRSIDFKPIKGFIFDNVAVAQKNNPEKPFLRIKQVSFNLLVAPFFQKKAIIIPNIKISKPYVYTARGKNRQWNFSDLLDRKKSTKRKNIPAILLRKLSLENGEIFYSDKTQKEELTEAITNINLNTTLSLNKGIRFIIAAQIPTLKTTVKIKGNHSLINKKLTAQIQLRNMHHARYLSLINESQPYVHFEDGTISRADLGLTYRKHSLLIQGTLIADNNNVVIGKNKRITSAINASDVLVTWQGQKWDAKAHLKLPSIRVTSISGKEFGGDAVANLNLLTMFDQNITSQGDITIKNAYFKVGEKKYFNGNISAMNASLLKLNDTIHLKGNVDVSDTLISIDNQTSMRGNCSSTETELIWSSADNKGNRKLNIQSDLKIDSALIALGTDLSINGTVHAPKSSLVFDNKKITVEAQGQISEATVKLKTGRQFQGNPQFNIVFYHDPKKKNPVNYTGTFNFTESLFIGAPPIEKIDNIEGIIIVKPDQIKTDGLTFNIQNTDAQLSGYLTSFTNPQIDVETSSNKIQLQKLLTLFPNLGKKTGIDVAGEADIKINYKGPVKSPSDAVVKVSALLTDTSITHEKLRSPITHISGQLNYKKNLLTWANLLAHYRNKAYTLDGQLANFSRPVINTKITSNQLALTTQVKILNQAFQLTSFAGKYLNSRFDLKGDVHFFDNADADIDLRGNFELDLNDIDVLMPRLKNKTIQLNPIGILSGEGLYKGKFKNWRDWQLVFEAKSNQIMLHNYPFENVSIRYAQRDRTINKFDISSTIYAGKLSVNSSADLRNENAPFTSIISLENLDLEQFRKDKNPKNQNLSGILSISTNLDGTIPQWRNVTGEGLLRVTDGYLWQWNILDGISGILLIPEFKRLAFTEADGSFSIGNQRIYTENAKMTGKTATLNGKGWVDFNQNLNFNIAPVFSELAILQSDSIKKNPTSILTQTKGYLNISLTGTLKDPKFRIEKFPIKIIEETIGGTTDTLKEVIGGIVDEIF